MIKLVSVNIEMDMHHDTVIPFLQKENADVVCIQELFQKDIAIYEQALGMKSSFAPMAYTASFKFGGEEKNVYGIAIFAKDGNRGEYECIVGDKNKIPALVVKKSITERNDGNVVLLYKNIVDDVGTTYTISTTHFTWTPPPGTTTQYQMEDAKKLIKILDQNLGEFILVGDFNAPRGQEAFTLFAEKYKDNIPLSYTSSLDTGLHRSPEIRSGKFNNMVDGLFSTPQYSVINVQLKEGVSDHKAIVATIKKS